MSARVLLAGLFHETHTFLEGTTPLDAFEIREGAELLTARGDGSPIDGFLEVAERHRWQVVPTIDMRATPSATVEDEALEAYWRVLREHLTRAVSDGFDALFLVLHGAMASASFPDVEGEVLTRIAHVLG
ncbi:MAG: M81 family metallopeptidase, partial [Acidimicrobiia bacterium]